jgi:hypothetical protein
MGLRNEVTPAPWALVPRSLCPETQIAYGSFPSCLRYSELDSTWVQSHSQRTVQDLPWMGLHVRLRLHVRRFFCSHTTCSHQIFTERLSDFAYARQVDCLHQSWALGGEAGSCLCGQPSRPVAVSTLLRLLCRADRAELLTRRALGVDDWGFQRQNPNGTILVDLFPVCFPHRKSGSIVVGRTSLQHSAGNSFSRVRVC